MPLFCFASPEKKKITAKVQVLWTKRNKQDKVVVSQVLARSLV